MTNQYLSDAFSKLSTPLIADVCLRLELALRVAPSGIHPLIANTHITGRVLPEVCPVCGAPKDQFVEFK